MLLFCLHIIQTLPPYLGCQKQQYDVRRFKLGFVYHISSHEKTPSKKIGFSFYSEKSDRAHSLKQRNPFRIHTVSGYAFAGSENIEMMVINDNPIKTVDSFAFAGLKNVKFLLLSSSVRHLHTVFSVLRYFRIEGL